MGPTTSKKPAIVFCDPYGEFYGAQRSLVTLYRAFQRQGRYRLHFVYIAEGPTVEKVRELGIDATRLEPGPMLGSLNQRLFKVRWWECVSLCREMAFYSRRLKQLLIEQKASLLHANGDRAALTNFLGSRMAGCPMVTHIRRSTPLGRFDRAGYAVSDDIVWVSQRVRDGFGERHHLSPVKGRVIYNARELPDADGPGTRNELLAEFGLPADALMVLVVASFATEKDHENLIESASVACRDEPRLRYLLAGFDALPGETRRKKIEGLARAAGLSQRVLFLGHRQDVGRLMRGADLLVNPSRYEALCGALIEATGYGLPCVATDAGGSREIIPDGHCGYIVPVSDPIRLAEATLALARDEQQRAQMRIKARAFFAEHFTVGQCADDTARFFDEIMARSSGAGR